MTTEQKTETPSDTTTIDPVTPPDFTALIETLAPEHKAHIEKAGYKDLASLVNTDIAAQQRLGRNPADLLVKPTGTFEDNPDGYLEVMRTLGAPADKSGYGDPPQLEGLEFKEGMWDGLTDLFAKAGVMPFMVPTVMQGVAEMVKGQMGEQKAPEAIAKERFDAGMDALRGAHGAKADALVADAKALIGQKDKSGEFAAFLDESGWGSDPRFVAIMAAIQGDYAESGLIDRDGGTPPGDVMTKSQALEKIAELERDPDFMKSLQNSGDPNHKQAVAKREQLYKLAY